jgi:hypothetical protein
MGRRMRPLNPADGVTERFACELRALRAAAGEPPFWKMARRCEVSKSALAAAVAGYELPTDRVTRAFVQVCRGDWPWWSERLAQARAQLQAIAARPQAPGPPQSAPSAALVPVRRMLPVPVQAMTRGETIPRTGLPPSLRTRLAGRRATGRRRAVLAGVSALVLAAAGLTIAFYPHSRPPAPAAPPAASGAYDQTIGPGCPNTALAKTTQGNYQEAHKWTQATAAHWTIPSCSNLIVYSAPTASSDPDRWQDEYDWYFDNVPKTARCTFHIYIPDSPDAAYTAAYDWTAGDTDYLDSTAFVIDQAAYRGQWFNQGPHVFPTGQAKMMITDARSDTPSTSLAAAAVRLTCA